MLCSMIDFTYFFSLRLHLTVSEQPVSITEIVLSVRENTSEQNHKLVMLVVTNTARVSVTQRTQPDQIDCYSNQGGTHLHQERVLARMHSRTRAHTHTPHKHTHTHTGVSQNIPGCSA